jgi:hypothetical protein
MEIFINVLSGIVTLVAIVSIALIANMFAVSLIGARNEIQYGLAMQISSTIINTTILKELITLAGYVVMVLALLHIGVTTGGVVLMIAQMTWFIVICIVKAMTEHTQRNINAE